MEHGSYNKTSVKQETKTLYERLKLPIDNKLALSVRAWVYYNVIIVFDQISSSSVL